MAATALHITLEMVRAGVVPKRISTSKVVKLLNHKKWHRHRVCDVKNRELLGGQRFGAGRNLDFDTIKVIQLKEKINGFE